ncbi:MAG: DUF4150 domain-containing protein [Polyangiaceae bacterium]|nr:DUF4150 domain-containing protein [Myxococcales bacterium]MCB9586533.1 DUF4150 domain-containing protein [Polyangiaceae bacterium]MCB9606040.1 DUF4150 domain-containing protein [Polyangiaceae bacterium]
MFANCSMGGQSLASPDTCNTPSASGVTPMAYANTANNATAVPMVPNVIFVGGMAHNLNSAPPMTNGDEAGTATGVASGTVMGPSRNVKGSTKVFIGGGVATRMSDSTMQNSTNSSGATLVPGQTKVLILS